MSPRPVTMWSRLSSESMSAKPMTTRWRSPDWDCCYSCCWRRRRRRCQRCPNRPWCVCVEDLEDAREGNLSRFPTTSHYTRGGDLCGMKERNRGVTEVCGLWFVNNAHVCDSAAHTSHIYAHRTHTHTQTQTRTMRKPRAFRSRGRK